MEGHSVAPLGFRGRTPTVQAQKVSHGAQCGILVSRSKPAERIQSTAGKMEIYDRTTPEIDMQSGSRTLNHYSSPSVDDDFGGSYRSQYRNYPGASGDSSER